MSGRSCVVYDPELASYDFGAGHPMAPIRVDLTMGLAQALGILDRPGVVVATAPTAPDEILRLVHTEPYLDAVKAVSLRPHRVDLRHGLGTEDNPTFAGMHEASARIVGATMEAARRVWTGEALHAVSIYGGLHHAMAASASGFCIYNDPAVVIAWLLEQGARRVAYVDIDVHHGDGVQAAFYDDPRVLTVSLHESPRTLFPGTGDPSESGGPHAVGGAVNVPLPPGTADGGWLRAFHAVVPPVLREFAADILVTQHGCDSHMDDPLAHLMLSVDGQRAAHLALHDLAHEISGGRWVATGGGGYAVVEVVPRSWCHLLAAATGEPIDPSSAVPEQWRRLTETRTGRRSPALMTDGQSPAYTEWASGYNPDSWLDRCVQRTRETIFPLHGIALPH